MMACSLAQCPETRVQITQQKNSVTMKPLFSLKDLYSIFSHTTGVDIRNYAGRYLHMGRNNRPTHTKLSRCPERWSL